MNNGESLPNRECTHRYTRIPEGNCDTVTLTGHCISQWVCRKGGSGNRHDPRMGHGIKARGTAISDRLNFTEDMVSLQVHQLFRYILNELYLPDNGFTKPPLK